MQWRHSESPIRRRARSKVRGLHLGEVICSRGRHDREALHLWGTEAGEHPADSDYLYSAARVAKLESDAAARISDLEKQKVFKLSIPRRPNSLLHKPFACFAFVRFGAC